MAPTMEQTAVRSSELMSPSVAVAIPCYNEATTIGHVVRTFRTALPQATVWVIDNASTDESCPEASRAGARILHEPRQGKGYAMQAILETIRADAVVIVDGDDTYRAEDVHALLAPVLRGEADMVVGTRLRHVTPGAMAQLRQVGNGLIVTLLNTLFRASLEDVLSGYRVLSRRCQRDIPLLAQGFEVETELTLQALQRGLTILELPIHYDPRPAGSQSKLSIVRDGCRILLTMIVCLRDHRPLVAFGTCGALSLGLAALARKLWLLAPAGGPTLPPAVLSGIMLFGTIGGCVCIGVGVLLRVVNRRLREFACLLKRRISD